MHPARADHLHMDEDGDVSLARFDGDDWTFQPLGHVESYPAYRKCPVPLRDEWEGLEEDYRREVLAARAEKLEWRREYAASRGI